MSEHDGSESIRTALDRSSLGAPEAQAARAAVSDDLARAVVERSRLNVPEGLGAALQPPGPLREYDEPSEREARLELENERLRNTLADVRAQHTEARRQLLAAPEATETVEWEYGVDYTHMVGTRARNGWTAGYTSRAHADQIAAERLDGKVFRRRAAGPWVPVDRAADEHEEGP